LTILSNFDIIQIVYFLIHFWRAHHVRDIL
jgi:hypothetical protein